MNLEQTQTLFWRAITHPEGIEAFLESANPRVREAFANTFVSGPTLAASERMNIYANAYFWRLLEVLAEEFPVTQWLLGDAEFHNLVTDFVHRSPSCEHDLRRLGQRFPGFARDAGRVSAAQAQIMEAEWAMVEVLDAADEAVLQEDDLAAIPLEDWPALTLRRVATVRLFETSVDFSGTFKAMAAGEVSTVHESAPDEANLIWRSGHQVFHRRVDPATTTFLALVEAPSSFADICAAACNRGVDPAGVAHTLRLACRDGLLRK